MQYFADLLSSNSLIGTSQLILKSSRIIFNHCNSQIPSAIALSLALMLDLATTLCFLLHITRFPPRSVQ